MIALGSVPSIQLWIIRGPSPTMPLVPGELEAPQAWGDAKSLVLPTDLARKPRAEELVWLHKMEVYEKVDIDQA